MSAVFAGLTVALVSIIKGIRWYLAWEQDHWELALHRSGYRRHAGGRGPGVGARRVRLQSGGVSAGAARAHRAEGTVSLPTAARGAAAGFEGLHACPSPVPPGSFTRVRLLLDDGAGHAESIERRLCLN